MELIKDSCTGKKSKYTSMQVELAKSNGFRPYIVNPGRSRYTGYWKANKPHGFGARHSFNGVIYDGQWERGLRHGQGALRKLMPDNTYNRIYVGQWKYGQKCGEGVQYYKNGVYFGRWKANKRDGLGMMIYSDGSQYVGEWKNDLWHGAGVLFQGNKGQTFLNFNIRNNLTLPENGNRYEGYFAKGQKHGEGIFYHLRTGQRQKGIWQNNNCQVSIMLDCSRNQADRPTPYPMPKVRQKVFDWVTDKILFTSRLLASKVIVSLKTTIDRICAFRFFRVS